MISVVVGFQYILKEEFSVLCCTVISKKLILLFVSFSIENVIVGIALLKKKYGKLLIAAQLQSTKTKNGST